mmetsp:Transcript_8307/g.30671  ORF Transcript_8307/g.30671 Transcript_8307/m.30671 type:complete len:166 (-) Transcript_8307:177-674(-)|eukprot:CAMPEP_0117442884 /NCGR_PEP_ID=MMETSP0759-20121206/4393_1 /TAXON_ID=63605 /ORGANISM="Percolomonas cosmopolitus, Strain WS" /LENGTH=165 /DNA_ID=CAMNT_0005234809 /DNA_START=8 /DNA_END=505 /DNA_ORIENTATION=+
MSSSSSPQKLSDSSSPSNVSVVESIHFKSEWKPLRNFIHATLNTINCATSTIQKQSHNLKHNVAVPLYESSRHNASSAWIIAQNMTREYPALLIASTGLFFAAFMGRAHRLRKFILGALVCTAVCYPDHAVRLFTKPVEYVQEMQRNYALSEEENKNDSAGKDQL